MDEYIGALSIEQGLLSEPGREFVAIRGVQDLAQRIIAAQGCQAGRSGQQEQVVIAEYGDRCRSEPTNITQNGEGIRPAIDEIPYEPETILRRIESNRLCEVSERGNAALHIADCIGSHGWVQTSAVVVRSQVTNTVQRWAYWLER